MVILNWLYEYWLPVKGFEGLYEASNFGRIRGLDRYVYHKRLHKQFVKGQILSLAKRKDGYLQVKLCGKHHLVHRIIAETFLDNPNDYPIINHKDQNPLNSAVWNLEWCDYYYNNHYADASNKRSEAVKKNCKKTPVVFCNSNGNIINYYCTVKEAVIKTGISAAQIYKSLNNNYLFKRGNVKNCYFKYA